MDHANPEPEFIVVTIFRNDWFVIGGVFSVEADAERYQRDRLADPSSQGVAMRERLTLSQIKDRLADERLGEMAEVLRPLLVGLAHHVESRKIDHEKLLNHTLIGGRVEWKGTRWLVTGATKHETGVSFRLLPVRPVGDGEEVWTGPAPDFTDSVYREEL